MLSDRERETLREEWSSAMMRRDYFGSLSGGYRRRERTAKSVVLVSSCGALVAALAGLPGGLAAAPQMLAGITALVSVWLLVVPNRTRAAECAELHSEWNQLADGCRVLWENSEAEGASASLSSLRARSTTLATRSISSEQPTSN